MFSYKQEYNWLGAIKAMALWSRLKNVWFPGYRVSCAVIFIYRLSRSCKSGFYSFISYSLLYISLYVYLLFFIAGNVGSVFLIRLYDSKDLIARVYLSRASCTF